MCNWDSEFLLACLSGSNSSEDNSRFGPENGSHLITFDRANKDLLELQGLDFPHCVHSWGDI